MAETEEMERTKKQSAEAEDEESRRRAAMYFYASVFQASFRSKDSQSYVDHLDGIGSKLRNIALLEEQIEDDGDGQVDLEMSWRAAAG